MTDIDETFNPSSFPIYCHISIADASNSLNSLDSGDFIMTSTTGEPSRYAQSTTAMISSKATTTSASTSARSTSTGSHSSRSTASAGSGATSSGDVSPTSVAATSGSETDSTGSGGLSSGAKAGIALAVIIAIALLGLLIFFLLRYRRKLQETQSELQRTQADAAAAAAKHADEKMVVDGILAAAGKPDTARGGRIVVADLGSRQSGDWRQFFASKANSAKQAISSVGSRGASRSNSKPGSRRASRIFSSRPGTSGGESVPGVPSLPSPSLVGETTSTKGEGSTVGLVSGEATQKHSIKRKPLRTPGMP
jgi:hypothetical protein